MIFSFFKKITWLANSPFLFWFIFPKSMLARLLTSWEGELCKMISTGAADKTGAAFASEVFVVRNDASATATLFGIFLHAPIISIAEFDDIFEFNNCSGWKPGAAAIFPPNDSK